MSPEQERDRWFEDFFKVIDTSPQTDFSRFFHPNVVYERPGYPPIVGFAELVNFYRTVRIIAEGKHTLDGCFRDDDKAVCWGRFHGRSKNGEVLAERFADAYVLESGLIRKRTTFFFRAAI